MTWLALTILALGVSRLTRLVVHDTITERLRAWIWYRWPASDTLFGDSEVTANGRDTLGTHIGRLSTGVRVFKAKDGWLAEQGRFVGNLISCHWCTSVWLGIIVWAGWWFYHDLVILLAPFALSEVSGLLNARD